MSSIIRRHSRVIALVVIVNSYLDEVVDTSILKTGRFRRYPRLFLGLMAQNGPHLAAIA
jgi:hypothetical protein